MVSSDALKIEEPVLRQMILGSLILSHTMQNNLSQTKMIIYSTYTTPTQGSKKLIVFLLLNLLLSFLIKLVDSFAWGEFMFNIK